MREFHIVSTVYLYLQTHKRMAYLATMFVQAMNASGKRNWTIPESLHPFIYSFKRILENTQLN